MSSLVRNERFKLGASALSTLGIAFIVTGIIAPAATAIYGGAARSGFNEWWLLVFAGWFLGGAALHFGGQVLLGRMK
jgi:hypothetical protein